jgi:hypothetical protein
VPSAPNRPQRPSRVHHRHRAPRAAIIRYQRERPGELIHIDIKKLVASTASAIASPAIAPLRATGAVGRGLGWDAVDDA